MPTSTLLLVDDHPHVLQQRQKNFEKFGYAVVTASSVPSAISVLENTAIAAVLLEYRFEGIDAEAVAYQIRRRFPSQPIVLLSAYSALPERILWLVDEYVMRSDSLETVVNRIEGVTRSHERNKANNLTVAWHSIRPNRSAA